MKRLLTAALLALSSTVFAATLSPITLLNPAGSTAGQAIISTGPTTAPAWSKVSATALAAQAANTVVANATASSASPTAVAMPSCSTANSALQYTSGTGFTCVTNSALTTSTLAQFAVTTSAQLAGVISDETGSGSLVFATGAAINPTSIGATTPGTGTFTNLSASGTLIGFPGRLLAIQTFTAGGTYTPTTGANRAIVEVIGAGGGSGGSAITSASQLAIGQGGNGGAYGVIWISSGLVSQTVTIGLAGTAGAAGGNGGAGGTSSFGALISCAGGNGGTAGSAQSSFPSAVYYNTTAATCTGTGTFVKKISGSFASPGVLLSLSNYWSGTGGLSLLGSGGTWATGGSSSAAVAGSGYGAGASGAASGASQGSALAGAAGAQGTVIVYEYQ